MLPSFLIIGAQKAATTYVQQILMEHPDVFLPGGEIPYFEDPDYYQKNITEFEQLFEKGCGKQAIGLKRPGYLHKIEVPERIYRHIPSAKLILVLRDPVDRAVSAYYHNAVYGFVPVKHINQGLMEVMQGKCTDKYPRSLEIIEFGFYYQHITRYLNWFHRSQMLILLHEEITHKPLESARSIYRFVGVDETYVPESLHSQRNVTVYSVPRIQMLKLRNYLLFTYSDDRMRLHTRSEISLIRKIAIKMIEKIDEKMLSRLLKNSRPVLSVDIAEALSLTYKQDTLKLEKFLGCSLNHWKALNTAA